MKSALLFIFVFIILLLQSCSKTERTVVPFPDDLKPYCMFKQGSYWIYRNDVTGAEDSSYLTNTPTIVAVPYSESSTVYYNYLNSNYGGPFIISLFAGFQYDMNKYILSLSFQHNDGGISIISNHIIKGYSEIHEDDRYSYRVIGTDDSLEIDNTVYKDILTTKFSRYFFFLADSVKYTFSFDKIHGLVRFVKTTNGADTTWSLKRSLILR